MQKQEILEQVAKMLPIVPLYTSHFSNSGIGASVIGLDNGHWRYQLLEALFVWAAVRNCS